MQVHYRSIQVTPKSRAATVAVGAAVLVVGGVLVVVGATLLLAAAAVAAVAGTGVLLYRRLAGRVAPSSPPTVPPRTDLDPRLEVFAPDDDRRLPPPR